MPSRTSPAAPGPANAPGFWLDTDEHEEWLADEARRQFRFYAASRRPDAGFYTLDYEGKPLPDETQELHTTTRLIHSYALAHLRGIKGADAIVDQGMRYLLSHHHDKDHGGYLWALNGDQVTDPRKLAYGHVFVLLAASSAFEAGHDDAVALIDDASAVLDRHFWEEGPGLLADEWNRDWTPFSTYRGMNANMHGVEALIAAYEATGREIYLERAARILDFFTARMARAGNWRIPEHYDAKWQVDRAYAGNPMFRPAGTTPGHSLELGRLILHHWELMGRPDNGAPGRARMLVERALADAWNEERGGLAYTLDFSGKVAIPARYWWPVTEGIGALAALIKLERRPEDEVWYRRLWTFADKHLIDRKHGGWFPELDAEDKPTAIQFKGKPDIYHAVQATLYPLIPRLSRLARPD